MIAGDSNSDLNLEVIPCLERALGARPLRRAPSLQRLLQYVVEGALAGRNGELKEYSIAVEVFDRTPDFDPRLDPIVRVQAAKLRKRLAQYYADEGSGDPIRIELPVGGYAPQFRYAAASETNGAAAATKPVVAVLPFRNLTGSAEHDYLCEGMAEELISGLGRNRGLLVTARTSSFAAQDRCSGVSEIARELGVDYLIEGSVRRLPQSWRLTARLIEAATGTQLWEERREGGLNEFFALERLVASETAVAVNAAATPALPAAPVDSQVFSLLMRAWSHWRTMTPTGVGEARRLFEQVTLADPSNYRGHVGLATMYAFMGSFGLAKPAEALAGAVPPMERACELAPDASEPWDCRASIESTLQWRFEEAVQHYVRAIALNPSNVLARHGYAINCLTVLGRFEEALDEMAAARRLDPLATFPLCDSGAVAYYAGRYKQAERYYRRAVDINPAPWERGRFELSIALLGQGRARDALDRFEHLDGVPEQVLPHVFDLRALTLAANGRFVEAGEMLERAGRLRPAGEPFGETTAMTLLELGRRGEALDLLESLVDRGDPQMRYLGVDPIFTRHLAREPRFLALLRRVGVPLVPRH